VGHGAALGVAHIRVAPRHVINAPQTKILFIVKVLLFLLSRLESREQMRQSSSNHS
jgi:hypothetical protein